MALEQVFKSPITLDRLQRNPLGEFADGFCCWLLEQGFSSTTIRQHLYYLSHVNEHVGTQYGVGQSIDIRELNAFLETYSSQCRKTGMLDEHACRLSHSVNRFLQYLRSSRLVAPPAQKEIYRPLLDAYLKWMRRYQHASDGTIEIRSHSIVQFLQWLGPEATPETLLKLTAERIETFFLSYAQDMGRAARHSMQSALRTFLRFCLHQGYIDQSLDLAVPTLRAYRLATVPRGLSDTEAQRVLRQIDRSSHVGLRDYAIVQLLYTYGVRGGQVRALQLADIDWVHNQILFKASKHGKDSRLPLTIEAGESLLNYLQNSRPPSSFPHVFLTCRAPYQPFSHSSSLSAIIERRIRAAGIESPSNGAHTFRHSFATRMLSEGHSMKAIADVLGHRHLSTTFIYTKVGVQLAEASGPGVAAGGVTMRPLKLQSALAGPIQDFINLRRLSGTDYQSQAQLLGYFDRFLFKQKMGEPRLNQQITDHYLNSLSHLAPRSRSNRFSVVRQLSKYLARSDPHSFVPEPLKVIPSKGAHQPYIYTLSEIQGLLIAASKLSPPNSLRPHTYQTLLGVLYSTGIRIGEALALNLEHFQSAERRLYIAMGKFRKARWAPLSDSTCQALEQYLHKRLRLKPRSPDSALFINQRSQRLHQCTVNQTFHNLLRQCGLGDSNHIGPRMHDLRHTFAVQRLLAWYRDGQDVNARLPWLATYMGHVDVHSTQVYLQATAELIEQVNQRFHNHYLYRVRNQGERK